MSTHVLNPVNSLGTRNTTSSPSLHNLTIGAYFPVSGSCWTGGMATNIAVDMAVEQINRRADVLVGYRLNVDAMDTKCEPGVALRGLYEHVHTKPAKLMLLGAALSFITQPIADAAKYWNLVQVSYGSTSPSLRNRTLYPRFFRTISSDLAFNRARVAVIKAMGWSRVATLHQNEASGIFSDSIQDLLKEFTKSNMSVITSEGFSGNPANQLASIKDKDARIIIGNFYEEGARQVFCEAYKQGLYGERYVWIIIGWYPEQWWQRRLKEEGIACIVDEMKQAVNGYLSTDYVKLNEDDTTAGKATVSGWLVADYSKEFTKRTRMDARLESSFAYDAMWAIALALNSTAHSLSNAQGVAKKLEDFTYQDSTLADAFTKAMQETSFLGVTGPVSFNKNGERVGLIHIQQLQAFKVVVVGTFNSLTNKIEKNKHSSIKWQGKGTPKDRTIQEKEMKTIAVGLVAFLCVLAAIGIIMALLFLAVNIFYRQKRLIKMSSPRLNNLIICGCVMAYFSVFLFGLDGRLVDPSSVGGLCSAQAWILSIGFTMAFGAMFAKTWRVHAIFKSITPRKKVIKDEHLFLIVAVFVLVDVCLLTLWTAINPMKGKLRIFNDQIYLKDDKKFIPQMESCSSDNMVYWLGVLYSYKVLLLLFGSFLAWETRNVTIPALNDSKFIGISIYNVLVLSSVGVGITMIIDGNPDARFMITGLFIIFCTSITLCLVFVPKIIKLLGGAETAEQETNRNISSPITDTASSTGAGITQENSVLKKILTEKERHLMELKRLLEGVSPMAKLHIDPTAKESRSAPTRRRRSNHGGRDVNDNSSESHVNFAFKKDNGPSIVCKSDLSIPATVAKSKENGDDSA
ncbi:gamma-aminobutyric acid type B receptor subunit 2-like [Actinia tenebrosa]|uniref:Gamma-aminobutyric acid type B receptor subunit 2 n=1 Tax=Actinia tenebrosa TaxID=6105 RepID=A0A6P8H722_ACTTE|nr:gamma-aminobutyric acid type B receptor subunit 2-like [Actinia tenebrosa]